MEVPKFKKDFDLEGIEMKWEDPFMEENFLEPIEISLRDKRKFK